MKTPSGGGGGGCCCCCCCWWWWWCYTLNVLIVGVVPRAPRLASNKSTTENCPDVAITVRVAAAASFGNA
jgi:hypothetical protein